MDQSGRFAASLWIVRQSPRRSSFSGAKAYMLYVEVLKKRYDNVGRTFCDAICIAWLTRSQARASMICGKRFLTW